ncbi:N-acetyl-alpha-D-glucosaminyl L-malate synthase BshA [Nosocomiicoccus sp. HMSC09A07]|uniref:N-acetyl-alpha-D-glucosaminyl L-malate synthase BshA n=1 Tax=Nosocomiicoccus sp. HMSC09A07 TaxID=1581145 RepID=UPI0008A5DA70|nr:N-acetyl-alpha-D-glucosaminyl L-malate synthase BshA [Nosocomiicoccus sp. HMSC09A07]OFS64254.1 N-acetyl-alpha-D-glucosaminyl L-malate synthase BshA [Nosocomiicoccus sp. HMSC09A07]
MKIGVTCYPSVGGSGIVATELAIEMAKLGHEIHFISSSVPFRLAGNYSNIYVHTVEINDYNVFKYRPYDITLASKIAEVIDVHQLDCIHMHYAIPHAVAGILANQMSKRDVGIITTLHGTDITVLGHDRSLEPAIRFGIEKSDITTAVSYSLKKQTEEMIQPNKEIKTIYNFVDEKRFNRDNIEVVRSRMKQHLGIDEDSKVIVHSSNFRKIKNITTIVEAFKLVRESVKSDLVLVGDGPEMSVVYDLAHELGVGDNVHLVGRQSDMTSFYKMSDLFMLLSLKESFGLALLEAMNCGCVPIGSNAGGIVEVIQHEKTGFIVDPMDKENAAQYAVELMTNEALYNEMREAMITDVRSRFSEKEIVAQYEDLYRSIIKDNNHDK